MLSDQAEALARLRFHGLLPADTTTAFAAGAGWSEAMDELDWIPGEVLVVGSSPVGALARVFLGSKAIKIVRYAPVPVVVVPAGVAAARAETAENEAARVAKVHDSTPGTAQAVTGSGADPVTA